MAVWMLVNGQVPRTLKEEDALAILRSTHLDLGFLRLPYQPWRWRVRDLRDESCISSIRLKRMTILTGSESVFGPTSFRSPDRWTTSASGHNSPRRNLARFAVDGWTLLKRSSGHLVRPRQFGTRNGLRSTQRISRPLMTSPRSLRPICNSGQRSWKTSAPRSTLCSPLQSGRKTEIPETWHDGRMHCAFDQRSACASPKHCHRCIRKARRRTR